MKGACPPHSAQTVTLQVHQSLKNTYFGPAFMYIHGMKVKVKLNTLMM